MESRLNVFQMYVENGHKVGFYVRRRGWCSHNWVCVLSVGGQVSGVLPGDPPYFENPQVRVRFANGSVGYLSCPGTYGYERVEAPIAENQTRR